MTDTTARIPTDAEIVALAYDCSALPETITDATLLVFAHAVLAKWGARPVAAPVGMQPVARIRYERNTPGRENEMPRVVSCNRMADGIYEVFTESQVQAMFAAVPSGADEYPPLVCDYCGALTPDPWHSSGMMNGKMSKHTHSCDACAALEATQASPVDANVQQDAERYRWLREYAIGAYITAQGKGATAVYLLTKAPALDGIGEETDTAIDAAIAAKQGGGV